MFNLNQNLFSINKVPERVRLLALERVVIFPHVLTGFQFDDPEDIAVIEGALRGSRLLAVGTIKDGRTRPRTGKRCSLPLENCGCLCRIVAHHRKSGGSLSVLLVGLMRVDFFNQLRRFRGEYRDPNRWIRIFPRKDAIPIWDDLAWNSMRLRIHELIETLIASRDDEQTAALHHLFEHVDSLEYICDVLSSLFGFSFPEKIALLREDYLDRRLELLIRLLTEMSVDSFYDAINQKFYRESLHFN